MFSVRTIMFPTDFSPSSDAVFRLACSLACDAGAGVLVLHVAEPPPFVTPGEFARALQPPDGYRQELEAALHHFQAADSPVPVHYRLEEGDPASAIIRAARETPCELIIMGTHGRTGLKRLLMGSVAEQVVRKAPCPVLTVQIPFQATELSAASG